MATKKKAKKRSTAGGVMVNAARNKSYKAAKTALRKAESRAKKAWKKALVIARKKAKSRKR